MAAHSVAVCRRAKRWRVGDGSEHFSCRLSVLVSMDRDVLVDGKRRFIRCTFELASRGKTVTDGKRSGVDNAWQIDDR